MSERKTKNHGQLKPLAPERPKRPPIPRVFHGRTVASNIPYDEAVAKYGLWEVRCLVSTTVSGKPFEPGDTAIIPGNDAVSLALNGLAEFTDKKISREAEVLAEAEKLGLDRVAQPDPVNFVPVQQPQPRQSWMKGGVAA